MKASSCDKGQVSRVSSCYGEVRPLLDLKEDTGAEPKLLELFRRHGAEASAQNFGGASRDDPTNDARLMFSVMTSWAMSAYLQGLPPHVFAWSDA